MFYTDSFSESRANPSPFTATMMSLPGADGGGAQGGAEEIDVMYYIKYYALFGIPLISFFRL